MLRATVVGSERISPSFVRVTFGGDDLADLEAMGFDQCFRLFFRRAGQSELRMPTFANNGWFAQYLLMSPSTKPWVRNYTFRRVLPERREAVVDFAVHDGGGHAPASEFAVAAAPGDEVGFFDEGVSYRPTGGRELLVGDESAVPAVLGILDDTPDLTGVVVLEVPTPGDIVSIERRGLDVHWVVRDDPHAVPGALARRTVVDLGAVDLTGVTSAWIAGERELATGVRRHLVGPVGLPRNAVSFTGYWRHGKTAG
jgi:NADPH-dependent ferric siderophore reductase